MKQQPKQYAIAAASLVLLTVTSHAATVAAYDFGTDASATTEAMNTTSSAVTAAGYGSSGRSTTNGGNFFGRQPSVAEGNSYISLTITVGAGFDLALGQLSFNYAAQANGGLDYDATFAVRSSVDGFAADIATTFSTNPLTSGSDNPTETATANLTGGSYDGLTSITFQLYGETDTLTSNPNEILRWDNITVTGDVLAVPEPSSTLFIGLGALTLVIRRRR